jgi:tRNA dimethylallyltransferase
MYVRTLRMLMPSSEKLPRLVAVVGPTASGKSSLAFRLARKFRGEIVSADSMQVYRRMDIGTAKPSREEREIVPHHLIDILEPDHGYSAALFRKQAEPIIAGLHKTRTPIFVVGGTGLYFKALTRGLFQGPGARPELRQALREKAAREGKAALHKELEGLDPAAAARIHRGDTFRIIRALEVYTQSSMPISLLQEEHGFKEAPYRLLKIGLLWDREELYSRIEARVDQMMAAGWPEEVQSLLQRGYSRDLKAMKALGYRHLTAHLYGESSFKEAVDLIKRDTRRFAKRQMTWFRADKEIRWVTPSAENVTLLEKGIEEFIQGDWENR